jgi:hypothetical protein
MTFPLRKDGRLRTGVNDRFSISRRGAEWGKRQELPRPEQSPFRLKRQAPSEIQKAIEASRYIYELKDEWDDAGSPGYTYETWRRAIDFLRLHVAATGKEEEEVLAPIIGPGPDGAIDLYWKTKSFELLITVPAAQNESAQFYGDDYGKQTIRGTLSTSATTHGLLDWITKN